MRLPKISNYNTPQNAIITRKIQDIQPPTYGVNVFTDKEKVKFVEEVERVVRRSLEYRSYISYLKETMEMRSCSFFQNISNRNRKFSIHIHHEPFTLFDLSLTVYNRFVREDLPLNYFLIAEEVMKLHYQNKVGLIPLSQTAHEAYHDGQLFIPLQSVYGNYLNFFREYEPYIELDTKSILHAKIKMSKEQQFTDMTVLNKRYVYLVMPDGSKIDKIEVI